MTRLEYIRPQVWSPSLPYRITFSQIVSLSTQSVFVLLTDHELDPYRIEESSTHRIFYQAVRLQILVYNGTLPRTESQVPDCPRRNGPTHYLVYFPLIALHLSLTFTPSYRLSPTYRGFFGRNGRAWVQEVTTVFCRELGKLPDKRA